MPGIPAGRRQRGPAGEGMSLPSPRTAGHRTGSSERAIPRKHVSFRCADSAISADCNWMITDRSLRSVAITYPRPNQAVNHRSGREGRHQRLAAPAGRGRPGQRPGDPAIRALRRSLRSVTIVGRYRPCAWHGPWHGTLNSPSTASAVGAIPCVIGAARADSARERTYGKEEVYGSIP
jgi:hypothetical protein